MQIPGIQLALVKDIAAMLLGRCQLLSHAPCRGLVCVQGKHKLG